MNLFDQPPLAWPDLFASHAKWRPHHTALVVGEQRLCWAEFNARLNRVANGLLSLGLCKGDKVALLMANSVEMVEVMFGAIKAGLVAVPLSTLLNADAVRVMIEDSEARALFVSDALRHLLDGQVERLGGVRKDARFAVGFAAEGFRDYTSFTAASEAEPAVERSLEDAAVIIYSSGTTGTPKGIVQTLRTRHHLAYVQAIEVRMDERSVALVTTALWSNGTWLMLSPALFTGATLVVLERFSPMAFLDVVQCERVTHTFMAPAQFIAILATDELERADLSSLRCVLSAGATLRAETRQAAVQRLSPHLFELYGLTEGAITMLKPEELPSKGGTVGRPMLGCDIAILDESDQLAPPGVAGEIIGYGAHLMRGYHRRPEATEAAIWRDERGRTWLRTGDIGMLDDDGYLTILDRKKDMINSGGLNIFPSDIEHVLGGHPDVLDITVVGLSHEKWGETPVALVIPRPGALATSDELLAWANQRLAKHQRLSSVEFRAHFPRNALGKVLKRVLREEYAERSANAGAGRCE